MSNPMWFSLLSNEEKENVAREWEKLHKQIVFSQDEEDKYNDLLLVSEDIEYYMENTRADYFAYLEKLGLTHKEY